MSFCFICCFQGSKTPFLKASSLQIYQSFHVHAQYAHQQIWPADGLLYNLKEFFHWIGLDRCWSQCVPLIPLANKEPDLSKRLPSNIVNISNDIFPATTFYMFSLQSFQNRVNVLCRNPSSLVSGLKFSMVWWTPSRISVTKQSNLLKCIRSYFVLISTHASESSVLGIAQSTRASLDTTTSPLRSSIIKAIHYFQTSH